MSQTAVSSPTAGWRSQAGVIFPVIAAGARESVGDIPALPSADAMDLPWLKRVLRLGRPELPELVGFRRETISRGDFDVTERILLQYRERCDGPASLLAKFSRPLSAPRWRKFSSQSLNREVAAYCELNRHHACHVPELVFAAESGGNFNLLFEDTGATPCDPSENADEHGPEHEALLQELAQLHGCFVHSSPASAPGWQVRQRDSARFVEHHYRQGTEAVLLVGGLPKAHAELLQRFAGKVATWHRFERHLLTLTHGDARLENALFLRRENDSYRASLTGWKLAGLRNPMYDVASLLANDLSCSARNNSESILIQRYCRIFEQSGIQYPVREAFNDYRFNLFGPLIFNICAAAFLGDRLTADGQLMKRIDRNCQAIVEWKSEALLSERSNVIA